MASDALHLLAETRLETVLSVSDALSPEVLIIDSIQTLVTEELTSAAGSVSPTQGP